MKKNNNHISNSKFKAFWKYVYYMIDEDNYLKGIILVLFFSLLLVLSFFPQVFILSMLYGYTLGFIFGYYAIFIYSYFIIKGLKIMFKTQIDNYTIKKPKSFFTKIIFEFNSIKYTLFSLFLILFIQTIVIVVEKPEQNNQEQINWFDHIWTSWLKSFSNENNLDLIYYPNSLNAGLIFTLISATLFKFLHWGWILVILFTYLLITFLIVFRKAIAKKIKAPKAPSNNAEKISQKENKKYLKMLKKSKIQNISFENPQEYELSSNFQDDSKIEDIENSDSKNDFLNYNSINSSENKIEEKSDPFDIGDTNIFTIETNDENNSKKDDPEEDIWSLEDENFLNNEREK